MSKKKSKVKKQLATEHVAPPADGGIIGHFNRHWKFWVSILVGVIAGGGVFFHVAINDGNTVAGDGSTLSVDRSTNNGDHVATGTGNIVAGCKAAVAGDNSTVAGVDSIAVGNGSTVDIDKSVSNITNNTSITSIIYSTPIVYNVNATFNFNGGSLELSTFKDVLGGLVTVAKSPDAPVGNIKVTLRDPNGLCAVAKKTEAHYLAAQVEEAVECAKIGEEIIAPIITPYANKSCTIERKFATNITRIYLVLAEDAWARGDYTTAKRYSHTILGIWGPQVTGDVAGIAAAIELDERGGSDSVLCEEAVRRFEKGDKEWLYQYLNRLARWGYVHPVALDSETGMPYLVSLEETFGLPRKLQYSSMYIKAKFPTKDGRTLDNGELIVMVCRGMGRFEAAYIPDPGGRKLPQGYTGSLIMPTAKRIDGRPRPVPVELQPKK